MPETDTIHREMIEPDHFPEIAERNGVTRRIEKLGISEELADSSERRRLFSEMDNDSYKSIIGYVNSITRGRRIPSYEYEDGKLPFTETPVLRAKDYLMNETFEAVRSILSDESLDDLVALQTAGLTLSGAINLIHPFKDGNGRTGRVMHYLVNFGTERGEQAVNEELYAVIAKTRVYDTDIRKPLNTTPPVGLDSELDSIAREFFPEYPDINLKHQAAYRVKSFLAVMQGKVSHLNEKEFQIRDETKDRILFNNDTIQAKTMELRDIYRLHYLRSSELENRGPDDVPDTANRIVAERTSEEEHARYRGIAGL